MATPAADRPEVAMSLSRSRDVFPSLLSFPANKSAHSMLMVFRTYRYEAPGERGILSLNQGVLNDLRSGFTLPQPQGFIGPTQLERLSAIELPFPSNLRDVDALRVERFEQGLLESAAGQMLAGAANAAVTSNATLGQLPGVIQGIGASGASFLGGVSVGGELDRALQTALGANLGNVARDAMYLARSYLPSSITRVADTVIGSAVNPRAALAFEGVELKTHSFSWTLAPKNSRESDILKELIFKIKRSSLPSYQTISTTSFKAYLKYPDIVDIYLLGVNAEYFMKFKTCMIRSVTVDYSSPGLVPILKGGKPAAVNLNLEFYEMDIHTSNDYGVTATETPFVSAEEQSPDPRTVGPR
jgi:hypothetical protein